MTRDQIRRLGFEILAAVEWLETHATTRTTKRKDVNAMEAHLKDIRKAALKIADAPIHDPAPDPGEPQVQSGQSQGAEQSHSPQPEGEEYDSSVIPPHR